MVLLFSPVCSQRFHVICVSHGYCQVWPWLIEFSGVALSCFVLSCLTILPDVLLIIINPDDVLIPLFKEILYSLPQVRRLAHTGFH